MSIFQNAKTSANPAADKSETIIGPSVKVEGDFKGESNVIVAGCVHGTLITTQNLTITETAKIHADIGGQNIKISGEVHGNILAKERLEITQSAQVTGDIEANILSIEAGAKIEGRCATTIPSENESGASPLTHPSAKKEKELKVGKVA